LERRITLSEDFEPYLFASSGSGEILNPLTVNSQSYIISMIPWTVKDDFGSAI